MEQRTQQKTLETILKHHKELISRIDSSKEVSTEQIDMLLNEISLAGAIIEEAEDRSSLSELLRYWSSVINDKTGKFPVVQLLPSGFSTQPSKRSSGWKIATLVQFMITVILVATTVLALIHTTTPPTHVDTTPTVQPSVTSIALPHLETQYHRFVVTIDVNAFLRNDASATKAFSQEVSSQIFLKNRRAGLVIVYGGAPDISSVQIALTIASKAYADLHQLGNQGPTFAMAAYYDPLYTLGVPNNLVTIDIFLFAQS